jgi:hypothetical protein
MTIQNIIEKYRPILNTKTSKGDDRCFFEDELNNTLYVFGPSKFIRQGFSDKSQERLDVIEFENGPYIGVGDEVLANKYAITLGITYDHGIPVAIIKYNIVEKSEINNDGNMG